MQRRTVLFIAPALLAVGTGVQAQDKAAKQKEIKEKAMLALQDFYAADPKLKDAVATAPGFAVFTTYGLSFGFGGAGGKGIAREAGTGKETYMNIAQASAGLQLGASDTRYLFVFNSPNDLNEFIVKGWDASAGASAGAGAGSKESNAKAGAGAFTGGKMYALTKTGLQVGAAVAGTKAWKDNDLN